MTSSTVFACFDAIFVRFLMLPRSLPVHIFMYWLYYIHLKTEPHLYTTHPIQQDHQLYQIILSLLENEEVSFGVKGTPHAFTVLAAKNLCPFWKRVLSKECPI